MSLVFFDDVFQSILSSLMGLATTLSMMMAGIVTLLVVGIIGWFVGRVCQRIVQSLLGYAKFDAWLAEQKLSTGLGSHSLSAILSNSIHWLVLSLFLQQAIRNVSLGALQSTASALINLIPGVILALWIVIIGLLVGRWLRHLIESLDFAYRPLAAEGAELLTIAATLLAALYQLNIHSQLVTDGALILFGGIVFTLALGVGLGLAFSIQQNGWTPLHQHLVLAERRETDKTPNKPAPTANAKQGP
jgi:hypothetical protein